VAGGFPFAYNYPRDKEKKQYAGDLICFWSGGESAICLRVVVEAAPDILV
jgi:hypothetical protein